MEGSDRINQQLLPGRELDFTRPITLYNGELRIGRVQLNEQLRCSQTTSRSKIAIHLAVRERILHVTYEE